MVKILILFYFFTFSKDNAILFEEGNSLYRNGKYKEAIDKYSEILKSGYESSELYYNLGNSYYKLNDVAYSIYYFEKSLILNPSNSDTNNNLSFAKQMAIDKIQEIPINQVSKFLNNISTFFTYQKWLYVSISIELLSLLFLLLYFFNKNSILKKRFFLISCLFAILFFISLAISFNSKTISENYNPAIIFENKSVLRESPKSGSSEIIQINEGTKVNVIEKFDENWSLVKLSNGRQGWILSSKFKLIR